MTSIDTTPTLDASPAPMSLSRHRPVQLDAKPNWRRIDLEMSIKPFARFGQDDYSDVARRVLRSWQRLIERADELAALLWVGDSTELMVWSGKLDQPLSYANAEGFYNLDRAGKPYFPGWFENRPPVPFMPNPPELTYRDLADIIAALKLAARELYGRELHLGIPIDPTPEFADSPFKYDEHVEILSDHPEGAQRYCQRFMSHQTALHADRRSFSGFPDGIPEGTPIGVFLGRQTQRFADAFGYDYVWLSNGFGYSHYAWHFNGDILETDGSWRFERVPGQLERLDTFWADFRRECPDLPIEFRGTNWSVGCDLATDAASHEIVQRHSGSDVGPPNVPVLKAELLAMDVAVYLTRMAGNPSRRLIYRAYLNDPWHEHNPWFDIYNREPFETFACMTCSRLRADGSLDVPTDLHVLSADTDRGEMPQDQINEVIPGYLRALEERPDRPGPIVWVYPFKDFHRVLRECPQRLPAVFNCDHYAWRGIEAGMPMNTVIEADEFADLVDAGRADGETIYVAPTPLIDGRYASALLRHVAAGGNAILHGSLDYAAEELLGVLGVTLADHGLQGDFTVNQPIAGDDYERACDLTRLPLRHHEATGSGGIREMAEAGDEIDVTIAQGQQRRVWMLLRQQPRGAGGRLGWVRGTVPFGSVLKPPYLRPELDPADSYQRPQDAMRRLAARMGVDIHQRLPHHGAEPVRLFIKRWRGSWCFAGSKPDTASNFFVRTPHGAPLYTGLTTPVREGYAQDSFSKTIYNEVRFFVDANEGRFDVNHASYGIDQSRGFVATGFCGETVTVFPDPDALREGRVSVLADPHADRGVVCGDVPNLPHRVVDDHIVIDSHTGPLFIKW